MHERGYRKHWWLIGLGLVACFLGCGRQGLTGSEKPAANKTAGGKEANPLPLARARVPSGFRIETVTDALPGARMMAFSPDGRLFVTQTQSGKVTVVPIGGGSPTPWATDLNRPHGIAFHGGYLYVAENDAVVRWPYRAGSAKAPGAPQRVAALPSGGMHFTRSLGFGPDGRMYVSVGSSCNSCVESDPHRAAILQFTADGQNERIYASGLRNAVGFTWDGAGQMWATENGTDNMGDNFPPDELNRIRDGGFYGWPFVYGNQIPDRRYGARAAAMVKRTTPPAFTVTAHSAPLGLAFYQGSRFPAGYRGDLFAALHGSWNRSTPSGYKVVRIHFENGRPVRANDFVTGFGLGQSAWARPVGILTAADGSLLITDDKGGNLFRVRYVGGR